MKCPLKRSKLAEKEEVCVCVCVGGGQGGAYRRDVGRVRGTPNIPKYLLKKKVTTILGVWGDAEYSQQIL